MCVRSCCATALISSANSTTVSVHFFVGYCWPNSYCWLSYWITELRLWWSLHNRNKTRMGSIRGCYGLTHRMQSLLRSHYIEGGCIVCVLYRVGRERRGGGRHWKCKASEFIAYLEGTLGSKTISLVSVYCSFTMKKPPLVPRESIR